MSFYALDGRLCPALVLDEFDDDGRPLRLVYAYKGTEGGNLEWRVSNSVGYVGMTDDGSSWTAATVPRGAVLYTEVGFSANLQIVLNHLVAAHKRRDDLIAAEQGGSTHGEPAEGVRDLFATPATKLAQADPADTDKLTKAERKARNRA